MRPGMLLLVHAAATVFMTGLIWFVQVVHYPLFASVGVEVFARYERAHARRTTFVVAPAMLAEALAALALLWVRPSPMAWIGAVLLGVIWLSTALLQVPQHNRLGRRFDGDAHRKLVRTNWVRTAAWSARSVIALWLLSGPY